MPKKTLKFAFWAALLFFVSGLEPLLRVSAQEIDNISIINGNPDQQTLPQNTNSPYSNSSTKPILNNEQATPQQYPLVASISADIIDFGVVIAGEALLRSNSISVIPSHTPYKIFAFEDRELQASKSGSIVPDTTCDNGSCNENVSAVWNNPLTYGFGFRCEYLNKGCTNDFTDKNAYKQFANITKGEQPQSIFSSAFPGEIHLLYKLNIPQSDTGNTYHNTIYYIISPQI